MADAALAKAWPEKRQEIQFEQARFSPDGTLLGFSISQLTSGDPEQVWLYDLRRKQLTAVSEAPQKDTLGFTVSDIAWGKDNTLYIDEQRIVWKNQSDNRRLNLAATPAGVRELKEFPNDVAATFAAQALPEANAEFAGDRQEQNAQFIVRADNRGHGAFSLTAISKRNGKKALIAQGSGELSHFIFDSQHSVVRYLGEDGIVTLDLNTGKRQSSSVVSRHVDATLLDVSSSASLIVYTRRGPCESDTSVDPLSQNQAVMCFARLQP